MQGLHTEALAVCAATRTSSGGAGAGVAPAGPGGAPAGRMGGLPLAPELCPPPPRTKWTRRVPHPVLIGHTASLTPY